MGYSPDEIYRWLQTLAVCLEQRGRNRATSAELAAIPAPAQLQNEAARNRLVEGALLQDVPDAVALQTNTIQEALAAEALLATTEPLATLRDAAVAELLGEEVFGADLDHMLDLFFEDASGDLRAALRELDELRWARTQRANVWGAPGLTDT